jgi:membrane-bound lytic murein transglycosylase D
MKWFYNSINSSKPRLLLLLVALTDFSFVYANQLQLLPLPKTGRDTVVNDDKSSFKSIIEERKTISGKSFSTTLNPQAVSFVQEYVRKQGRELERMKIWGRPYFNLYDDILIECGVPKELKYLSVIESHLQSNLVSWAGAVGPWQLMDYEAHRFGLRTGIYSDDRTDFHKSTYVAAKLIKQLYEEFSDWLLVIAAYNGGAGRVRQAIRRSGSKDFWTLQYFLPEETRTHVKKYIGTHYLFEGGGGLTTMTAGETKIFLANQSTAVVGNNLPGEDLSNTDVLEISGRYNSRVIISSLQLDDHQFNRWNPGIDKALAEGRKYRMRLTKDKLTLFEERKKDLLLQSIRCLLDGTMRTASSR